VWVEAKNIGMQFNDAGRIIDVFSNLSLRVESGASLAVVGESGVGKTTLLYVLGTLEKPVTGSVSIGGTVVTENMSAGRDLATFRGKNIGFIFQSHYLLPEFDAVENVEMPLLVQGVSKKEAKTRAVELLERLGLEHRLSHRPGALSGGEQQRVAVARAFAAKPGVVLADEPTGNLDLRTGGEVNKLLKQLQEDEGITLIVVTHSLELAKIMDHVVELTPKGLVEREGRG
jgi:lipoprotein-releasing system ATP-binding protein